MLRAPLASLALAAVLARALAPALGLHPLRGAQDLLHYNSNSNEIVVVVGVVAIVVVVVVVLGMLLCTRSSNQ